MADYFCVKECNTYNKRFKPGDQFPALWVKEGYLPNHHFKQFQTQKDALEFVKEVNLTRPVQCAGDDPRSNSELRIALAKYMNVPESMTRMQLWNKLQERENAEARTEAKVKK